MTARRWLTAALAALAAAAAGYAVTVTARVPASGDAAADHDAALAAARRLAVEQAVGVLVDSRVRLENQLLIQDKVLTRAAGLVKNEKVEKEGIVEAGLYELTLTCDVEQLPLEDLLHQVRRSVAVRITVAGDEGAARDAIATARGLLADAGYKVLDEEYIREAGLGDAAPATDELKAFGRRYLAQVLLYGEIKAVATTALPSELPYVPDNPLAGLKVARVEGAWRAVDTASGQVLAERAAAPREFVGFGETDAEAAADALARAAAAWGAYFAAALAPRDDAP